LLEFVFGSQHVMHAEILHIISSKTSWEIYLESSVNSNNC